MKAGESTAIALTFGLAGTVLVAAAAAALTTGVPIAYITQDVAAIAKIHPLAGALSSAGILLWWTSASVWVLLATVQRRDPSRHEYRFALCSALLSAYLALDDLFQFHEDLAGRLFGLDDKYVYAVLLVAVAWYAWSFKLVIVRSHASLIVLAVGFLGASVGVDAGHLHRVNQALGPWKYLLEDGTKWMGITFWCAYALRRCHEELALALPGLSN